MSSEGHATYLSSFKLEILESYTVIKNFGYVPNYQHGSEKKEAY